MTGVDAPSTGRSGPDDVAWRSAAPVIASVPVPGGRVDVHRSAVGALASWAGVLSAEERRRAQRYHRRADRERSVTAWILARLTMAHRLDADPHDLSWERRCRSCGRVGHGKPIATGAEPWELSVSHAGAHVLVAVSNVGQVGVDLEPANAELVNIAGLIRGPGEDGDTVDQLLRLWVRKEAVLKATGDGLSVPMTSFTVDPVRWPIDADTGRRLQVIDLPAPTGYAAALAVILGEACRP